MIAMWYKTRIVTMVIIILTMVVIITIATITKLTIRAVLIIKQIHK